MVRDDAIVIGVESIPLCGRGRGEDMGGELLSGSFACNGIPAGAKQAAEKLFI
jgi:hypothetical protein